MFFFLSPFARLRSNANSARVLQRPYLKTFLRYVMHPKSPYSLAIWTFSGRMYGIAHLRQVGMGSVWSRLSRDLSLYRTGWQTDRLAVVTHTASLRFG